MRKTIHRLLLAAMLFAVPSCIVDKKVDFPEGPEKGAFELVLRLKTPGGFSTPETRALTYAQENTITDIYVLVFYGGDDLVAIKRGKNVKDETENIASPTPNHYSGGGSFSVDLTEFDTGNRYQLVVLANAESILSSNGFIDLENVQFVSPYLGAGFDEVAAAISATLNTKYTATTIPMWGQTGLTHINPVVQLPAIEMRRALARIDVGMGAYDESDNSWDGMYHGNNLLPEDDREIPFRMTSVRIMRPNNAYTVIPDPDDVTAGLPSLAGTSHTVAGSEVFDYTDIVDGHYITRSIYVPEANVRVTGSGTYNDSDHDDRMAVIVGGNYDSNSDGNFDDEGDPTYYRLEFIDSYDALLDVYRNHLYTFTIIDVSGPGYSTVEEAYEAAAFNNITASADVRDDIIYKNVIFDDNYHLAYESDEFFVGSSGGTLIMNIQTNYPGGWTTKVCDEYGNEIPDQWLGVAEEGAAQMIYIAVYPNESTENDRTAYIHFTVGRMSFTVPVTQERQPVPSIRATPGVIGYYANGSRKGELTLAGDDGDDHDVVYVAYFKFGSLLALGSQDTGPFSHDDIIQAPSTGDGYMGLEAVKEYVGTYEPGGNAWEQIPPISGLPSGMAIMPSDATTWDDGFGDPCEYYFDHLTSYDGGRWRMPTSEENIHFIGYDGTVEPEQRYFDFDGVNRVLYRWTDNSLNVSYPGLAQFLGGTAKGTILPTAGIRDYIDGDVSLRGEGGYYWSSTSMGGDGGPVMLFNRNSATPDAGYIGNHGLAVRCIQPKVATFIEVQPRPLTFDWDANDPEDVKTVWIITDGPWEVTNPDPTNFEVVVTDPSTPSRPNGSFTVVPTSENNGDTDRTVEITVSSVGSKNPALTQKVVATQLSLYGGGVKAPAGVIGYYAADGPNGIKKGDLTLDGDPSLTYGGGTSPVPVYVALFKYGSLIATDSSHEGDYVTAEDVVQVPRTSDGFPYTLQDYREQYLGSGSGYGYWSSIESVSNYASLSIGDELQADVPNAIGDACDYYFGDGDGDPATVGAWRMPTAVETVRFIGGPYGGGWERWTPEGGIGVTYRNDQWDYLDRDGEPHTGDHYNPHTGSFPLEYNPLYHDNPAFSQVLPAAGERSYYNYGTLGGRGTTGAYWTSTARSHGSAYYMGFDGLSAHVGDAANDAGLAIRCIQPPPVATNLYISSQFQTLNFPWQAYYGGGGWTQRVEVSANGPWQVHNPDPENFTVTIDTPPSAGNGWFGIFVVAPTNSNNNPFERKVDIWVSAIGNPYVGQIVEVTQEANTDRRKAGENHVLYFATDGNGGTTIRVGRWETQRHGADWDDDTQSIADRSQLAFFKFGSVVGFTNNGDTFGPEDVLFDPTFSEYNDSSQENYRQIPAYTADDFYNYRNVSDRTVYHTEANVLMGKGDPCMLAGYDLSQADSYGYFDGFYSGWRMATAEENRMFIGNSPDESQAWSAYSSWYKIFPTSTWSLGNPGTGVFPLNPAGAPDAPRLPAAGGRDDNGANPANNLYIGRGERGLFWSSTATSSSIASILYFNSAILNPSLDHTSLNNPVNYNYGLPVRCVRVN